MLLGLPLPLSFRQDDNDTMNNKTRRLSSGRGVLRINNYTGIQNFLIDNIPFSFFYEVYLNPQISIDMEVLRYIQVHSLHKSHMMLYTTTVKLVLRDSSRDFRKRVTYDRWSLNSG
jgi:hypothetical protein